MAGFGACPIRSPRPRPCLVCRPTCGRTHRPTSEPNNLNVCGTAPITPLGPHSTTVASCGHDETIARHRRNWDRAELLSMESNRACLKTNPFGRPHPFLEHNRHSPNGPNKDEVCGIQSAMPRNMEATTPSSCFAIHSSLEKTPSSCFADRQLSCTDSIILL